MIRRTFLALLAGVPCLRWGRPKLAAPPLAAPPLDPDRGSPFTSLCPQCRDALARYAGPPLPNPEYGGAYWGVIDDEVYRAPHPYSAQTGYALKDLCGRCWPKPGFEVNRQEALVFLKELDGHCPTCWQKVA